MGRVFVGNELPEVEDGKLPSLGNNATSGQLGEALVEVAMLQLDQLYERRAGLDFGVDGVIELTTPGELKRATGRQVGVQVKRGLSVVKKTRFGYTYYCTEEHANYWKRHSLPIIIVHNETDTNRLRWQHVNKENLRRKSNGYAIDLPEDSNLHTSLEALRALADGHHQTAATATRTLVVPYSEERGVSMSDPDLGLAALEFSRAALRGVDCRLLIDVEEEPDIIRTVDGIQDVAKPTPEERRNAVLFADILFEMRKRASRVKRALVLLLTHKSIAEAFGYDDQLISAAIRRLAAPRRFTAEHGTIGLEAWPSYEMEGFIVRFDVPNDTMTWFYAQNNINSVAVRLGKFGGCLVGDLPQDIITTHFLPMLAKYLVNFADRGGVSDEEILKTIDVQPSMWRMGLA